LKDTDRTSGIEPPEFEFEEAFPSSFGVDVVDSEAGGLGRFVPGPEPSPGVAAGPSGVPVSGAGSLGQFASAPAGGPMDLFWAGLAPFSVFAAFGVTVLVVVFVLWTANVDARSVLGLGAAVFLFAVALLLPVEYYLVKTARRAGLAPGR
jgi:hypothetical protein